MPIDESQSVGPSWSMYPVKRYLVSGRVQGVGFRWWTLQLAKEWKLEGHVRNLEDGDVEVVLAGESMFMAEVEKHLHHGPAGAHVVSVTTKDVPPGDIPVPTGFQILWS